jgi:cytochrome P450
VDFAISNILDKVVIMLINPEFIKEFHSGNTPYIYTKIEMLVAGTKAAFGEGLVFSEGEMWKNKRKLLSKVFNFDLIKENIPKIVEICNKCYEKFDESHKVSENKVKYNTLSMSANIFNGVIMKCFFGHDHINDQIGDGKDYA